MLRIYAGSSDLGTQYSRQEERCSFSSVLVLCSLCSASCSCCICNNHAVLQATHSMAATAEQQPQGLPLCDSQGRCACVCGGVPSYGTQFWTISTQILNRKGARAATTATAIIHQQRTSHALKYVGAPVFAPFNLCETPAISSKPHPGGEPCTLFELRRKVRGGAHKEERKNETSPRENINYYGGP